MVVRALDLMLSTCGMIGLGLIAVSPPVAAQENSTDQTSEIVMRQGGEPDPIIVTGERAIEKDEVRNAVRDIAMRGREFKRPMSQFQMPLCVSVVGLGKAFGNQVAKRIERNTREAGFMVDSPGCDTNALVVVVKDPPKLIKRLRKTQPRLFNVRASQQIRRAKSRGDAAITWSLERRADPGGNARAAAQAPAASPGSALFGNAGVSVPTSRSIGASRFFIGYSRERVYSIVIFDVERLGDVHLNQLADFATMRVLADPQPQVDLDDGSPADSILTLYDVGPKAAPPGMTQIDRAFLKGLYALRPNDPSTRLESFVLAAYDDVRERDCEEGRASACPPLNPDDQ